MKHFRKTFALSECHINVASVSHEHSTKQYKGRLKHLDNSFYTGKSYVHWTMCVHGRATGWLNNQHHEQLRELLFHTLARYHLCCPVDCIMPDHAHFLWIGLNERTNQLNAAKQFRREWNQLLAPQQLDRQAYDSVLTEEDRQGDAYTDLVFYILKNPTRKALVENWQNWPHSGAIFPGYPKLDPRKDYFRENFWKAHLEQAD